MSRKKSSGVTRQEILDIAWELIAAHGAEISMKEIAAAAKVSRQSVYLHFKSRGGLLMALVRHADARFMIREELTKAMKIANPVKRLDECLNVWFDFLLKIRPVASDLVRLRETDVDAAAAWDDRMADLWGWEHALIQSLADDNVLANHLKIEDATDILWSLTSIQIWNLFTGDRNWNADKSKKMLRQTIARTLLASA
jgi:AcrR family transcriptional regulator